MGTYRVGARAGGYRRERADSTRLERLGHAPVGAPCRPGAKDHGEQAWLAHTIAFSNGVRYVVTGREPPSPKRSRSSSAPKPPASPSGDFLNSRGLGISKSIGLRALAGA